MFNKKRQQRVNFRNPKIYNPPKEEDKTKTKTPKWFKIIIILFVVLIAVFSFLFFAPIFKIRDIQIIGSLPDGAQNYLNQFKGQNIFLVKSDLIVAKLQNDYPEFMNVSVYKGIPDILKVKFNDRGARMVWQTNGQSFLVDSGGTAFKAVNPEQISGLPVVIDNRNVVIKLPAQVVTGNFINFITDAKLKIKDSGLDVKQFAVNETFFQVDATTNSNIKIIFDITKSLSDQMDAFSQVYKDHKDEIKQYVDVRVEGKAYYQ